MKLEGMSDRKLELLVDRWVKNSQWWADERSGFSSWSGAAVRCLIDAMRFQ